MYDELFVKIFEKSRYQNIGRFQKICENFEYYGKLLEYVNYGSKKHKTKLVLTSFNYLLKCFKIFKPI